MDSKISDLLETCSKARGKAVDSFENLTAKSLPEALWEEWICHLTAVVYAWMNGGIFSTLNDLFV